MQIFGYTYTIYTTYTLNIAVGVDNFISHKLILGAVKNPVGANTVNLTTSHKTSYKHYVFYLAWEGGYVTVVTYSCEMLVYVVDWGD